MIYETLNRVYDDIVN